MNKETFTVKQFEKDSLAVFEKLLQGYSKAMQSGVWNKKTEKLINNLIYLPTAPFERKLMELFDYRFFVLSSGIDKIIEKSLVIQEQMQNTNRFVHINKSYYNLPFFPKQTYLKRFTVYNHEHELCYSQTYKLKINSKKLWHCIMRINSKKKPINDFAI